MAIHVIGRMSVVLDGQSRIRFQELTQNLFEHTFEHDQPLLYTCSEDINASGTFVWDEIWESKEALDAHLGSAHFKQWWEWVEPKLAGPLQVNYVEQDMMKIV